jgi:hypothetical protein
LLASGVVCIVSTASSFAATDKSGRLGGDWVWFDDDDDDDDDDDNDDLVSGVVCVWLTSAAAVSAVVSRRLPLCTQRSKCRCTANSGTCWPQPAGQATKRLLRGAAAEAMSKSKAFFGRLPAVVAAAVAAAALVVAVVAGRLVRFLPRPGGGMTHTQTRATPVEEPPSQSLTHSQSAKEPLLQATRSNEQETEQWPSRQILSLLQRRPLHRGCTVGPSGQDVSRT